MSKISSMMDVGRRSMQNSQTGLQTVGHNIANKDTEGYSRQRVEAVAAEPHSVGQYQIGQGAKTSKITRVNNPYLEKQLGHEQASLGQLTGKLDGMTRVEQVFNEQVNKGLNQFLGDFYNSFRELGNNPESMATRTLVRESADLLTKDFKRINKHLTDIRKDLDGQIANNVEEINSYSGQIAELNSKIQYIEAQGSHANDERDRRDMLLKELGEKVNIKYAEGDDGMMTISAGNSCILVSGHDANKLSVSATGARDNKGEANYDIFYHSSKQATPLNATKQFSGGEIGGLLEVRDDVIGGLLGNLDELAYNVASNVNKAHRIGIDGYNKQGQDFFVLPTGQKGASELVKVSEAVMSDVGRIVSAASAHSPGDNRVANLISSMQHEKLMANGQSTMDEFYNSMVGEVGILTKRAATGHQAQNEIVKQLTNIRDSISGVSLDEETTKMIEFQKAFDASARLIRTADEMFDTVLNLKRM